MTFSVADLKKALESLHDAGSTALEVLDDEFEEINSWLEDIQDAVTKGDLNRIRQVAKTPGKKRGALGTINESVSNMSQLDVQSEPETLKKPPKKESKRFQAKRKQASSSGEDPESENESWSKRHRGTMTNDSNPAFVKINDTTVSEANNSSSEVDGNERLTRTRVQRTTIVKETRETFVIEKASAPSRAPSRPPVLQPPSPIDLTSPEPVHKFKSPPQLKPRTISAPEGKVPLAEEASASIAPPTRMTRTKTRAMAKASQKDPPKTPPAEKSSGHDSEHESESAVAAAAGGNPSRLPVPSSLSKQKFGTPVGKSAYLSHSQLLGTPLSCGSSNIITGIQSFITKPAPASVKKDRQEEFLQKITQKTNDASKKREELIKAQTEEKIKKRQEKVLKVNAAREAMEKERAEKLRLQMAQEEEKRRKMAQQKAQEAAEAAKAAKRQQEEEQRRLAEERRREEERRAAEEKKREQELLRQQEERKKEEERRRMQEERKRQLEEKKRKAMEAELRKKEAEKAAAQAPPKPQLNETFVKPLDETFVMPTPTSSYDMTPMPEDRKPAPSKSMEDYGIEDAGCDDSSDDESNPKKEIPTWAQGKNRMPRLASQFYIRHRQAALFFGSKKTTPDLSKIFVKIDRKMLIRKSSAVWRTPPVKFLNDSVV